jgi:adenylylsulfate kinase
MTGDARRGACIWLTGPAGSGKTTIARALTAALVGAGAPTALLDEHVRGHLADGRDALTWLTRLLADAGLLVVVALDLASRDDRERVRAGHSRFAEVFVDAGTDRTDERYEEPFAPDLRVPTHDRSPEASTAVVLSFLEHAGWLAPDP